MMNIRHVISGLLVVLWVTYISPDVLSQDTDSLKCWSTSNKLKWSDFKGKKPDDAYSADLHAASGCRLNAIPFFKDGLLRYQVTIAFIRYESWKSDTADYLLKHEQLHFDIAELYARKIRKAIQGIVKAIPKAKESDFRPVIQKLYGESADAHAAYDKETYHGIITDRQATWEKKISIELKQLNDYASTIADCQ
jgi:hypothetical protein